MDDQDDQPVEDFYDRPEKGSFRAIPAHLQKKDDISDTQSQQLNEQNNFSEIKLMSVDNYEHIQQIDSHANENLFRKISNESQESHNQAIIMKEEINVFQTEKEQENHQATDTVATTEIEPLMQFGVPTNVIVADEMPDNPSQPDHTTDDYYLMAISGRIKKVVSSPSWVIRSIPFSVKFIELCFSSIVKNKVSSASGIIF